METSTTVTIETDDDYDTLRRLEIKRLRAIILSRGCDCNRCVYGGKERLIMNGKRWKEEMELWKCNSDKSYDDYVDFYVDFTSMGLEVEVSYDDDE